MIFRTIVFYFVVQTFVVGSPDPSQRGEPIASPTGTFYHATPPSRSRLIPEVGKLPRTWSASKKYSAGGGPLKMTPGNNHPLRSGRNPVLDTHQLPRIRGNRLHMEDQRPRTELTNEEKAEKMNSDLEKMIQFMSVLGQIDRYLSSRAKSFVSTLGRAMENIPDDNHLYNDRDTPTYEY